MDFIIREAKKTDINAMLDLLSVLFSIEEDFDFDLQKQKKGLELLLENPKQAKVFVCEHQQEIIGMVSLQINISTAEGGFSALLEDFIIKEKYRNQGLGKLFLKSIDQWCCKNKISRIQLLADRNNRKAINFYLSNGWDLTQLIALRKKNYSMD